MTEFVPSVRSASVGVWVGVGSRDEAADGGRRRALPGAPAVQVAPTPLRGRDRRRRSTRSAVSSTRSPPRSTPATTRTCSTPTSSSPSTWCADVVLDARCAVDDVEVERGVVLEEIAMRDDDPEDRCGDVFCRRCSATIPLGRPVIGTVRVDLGDDADQLHSFHLRRYTPERMVVAVAGNIDHDRVVALVVSTSVAAGPRAPATGPQGHRTGGRRADAGAGEPGRRAGAHAARRAFARSALAAPLGAVGAQLGARWRPEFPSVPTDPGDPRVGVLGVLDGGHLLRHRRVVGVRGVSARAIRRGRRR